MSSGGSGGSLNGGAIAACSQADSGTFNHCSHLAGRRSAGESCGPAVTNRYQWPATRCLQGRLGTVLCRAQMLRAATGRQGRRPAGRGQGVLSGARGETRLRTRWAGGGEGCGAAGRAAPRAPPRASNRLLMSIALPSSSNAFSCRCAPAFEAAAGIAATAATPASHCSR